MKSKVDRRTIDKETILYYLLKNENLTSFVRQMKIDTIFNSEILVMDSWSSKFYNDLSPKERQIRKDLDDKYKFYSFPKFIEDDDYKNLNSLSEALISLVGEQASWVDIHMVIEKLKLKDSFLPEEQGSFSILREKCIKAIINYFDK